MATGLVSHRPSSSVAGQLGGDSISDLLRLDVHLPYHVGNDPVFLIDQREEHVLRLDLRMTAGLGGLLRRKEGFLRLFRHVFQIHVAPRRASAYAGVLAFLVFEVVVPSRAASAS